MSGPSNTAEGPNAGATDDGTATGRRQTSQTASGLAIVGAVVTTVANFFIAWLVSSAGSDVAGTFFVATAIITIGGNGSCLGTMTGMVYFLPQELETDAPNPRSLLAIAARPVLLAATCIAVGLMFLAPVLARLVAPEAASDVTVMLRLTAIALVPWALTVTFLGATRGMGTMTPTVAIGQVLRPGLQIIFLGAVFARWSTPSASAIAVGWGAPVVLSAVAALVALQRLGGLQSSNEQHVTSSEFWAYTKPRALSTAMQVALERLDVVLVSAFVGVSAAGVYGALTRYISAGNFLIFSIGQATSANLRRAIAKADWDAARSLLHQATGWLVLIAWPYFLLVALKPEPLAELLSEAYVADAKILTILAIGMLVSAAAGPIDLTLLMLGQSKKSLLGVAAAIVTDVVLVVALTPAFGLTGAAIAWVLAVTVQNGLATWFVRKNSSLQAQGRPAITAAAIALAAIVPASLLSPQTFVGLLIAGIVGGALWLLLIAIRRHDLGLAGPRRP